MVTFIETKLFTRLVEEYLSDDSYRQLQAALASDPEAALSSLALAVFVNSGGESLDVGNVADLGSSIMRG